MPERTYTTTEVSRVCDVYPATVINWIDSGKLKAYVTPGGHRRVTREVLAEFLKSCNIAVPPELNADRKYVLIVEDEPDMAKILERAFAKRKDLFETQTVADGIEALLSIGKRTPHLVVLDIVMPKMNGLEVCEKLRSMPQTRPVKIIAVSGKKLPEDSDPSDYGIHAFFRKPLELADLVKTAAKLLQLDLTPFAKDFAPVQPLL